MRKIVKTFSLSQETIEILNTLPARKTSEIVDSILKKEVPKLFKNNTADTQVFTSEQEMQIKAIISKVIQEYQFIQKEPEQIKDDEIYQNVLNSIDEILNSKIK